MSNEIHQEKDLSIEEQSDLIVKVFQVSIDTLMESGLQEVDALNGMLSQIAILVDPEALNHALELNKKFRKTYIAQQ